MDVSWMYQKKRGRPESGEKKPKFTGSKKFYLEAGVALFLIIGGLLIFYFVYKSGISTELETIDLSSCASTLNSYKDGELSVILCVKEDGSLAIFWQNLPKDTMTLNIYRTDKDSGDSVLWKTINVTGGSGSLDLGREADGSATYNIEGVGEDGSTIWSSVGNTMSAGTAGSPNSSGQTSTSSTQIPTAPPATTPPPATPPTTTPPPSTPPPTIPPPTEPPPIIPPADTSTIYYYTPSGQISGTSSISIASFWVQHVNQKIEIGWQNIPSSTTKIIIYRSQSQSGGYVKLLEQSNLLTSYFIRLEDNAIFDDYYYKMEAKNGSTLIATYGPVFLEALESTE